MEDNKTSDNSIVSPYSMHAGRRFTPGPMMARLNEDPHKYTYVLGPNNILLDDASDVVVADTILHKYARLSTDGDIWCVRRRLSAQGQWVEYNTSLVSPITQQGVREDGLH